MFFLSALRLVSISVQISGALHLKSLLTMAGPDVILVSRTKDAEETLKVSGSGDWPCNGDRRTNDGLLPQRVEREATFQYQVLRVEDRDAANCLYVNGTLIHRPAEEFPASAKVFDGLVCARAAVNISELAKPQAALTCLSILIRKPRHIKSL